MYIYFDTAINDDDYYYYYYVYLHFDGFIPVYNVTGKGEQLDVDEMYIAPFRSHVQPFAAEWKVYDCNSARHKNRTESISKYCQRR